MSKVKLELSKKTAAQKIDFGKTAVTQMTGNATTTCWRRFVICAIIL